MESAALGSVSFDATTVRLQMTRREFARAPNVAVARFLALAEQPANTSRTCVMTIQPDFPIHAFATSSYAHLEGGRATVRHATVADAIQDAENLFRDKLVGEWRTMIRVVSPQGLVTHMEGCSPTFLRERLNAHNVDAFAWEWAFVAATDDRLSRVFFT